ncbi:hypothetical protein [Pseudalkalibacillus sp. SCS-8]|uniref:hypothetical protein n=1 Tax=Pseudalkalibacillus nanhaiensis TaxID=3115291 RepID=UPI0032D9D677
MKRKHRKYIVAGLLLSLLAMAVLSNLHFLEKAKQSCIHNDMEPEVQTDFLTINWTVSCK